MLRLGMGLGMGLGLGLRRRLWRLGFRMWRFCLFLRTSESVCSGDGWLWSGLLEEIGLGLGL